MTLASLDVLFFTTPALLQRDGGDTRYLFDALQGHACVRVSSEPEPGRCAGADVVFNRFPFPIERSFLAALVPWERDRLIVNRPSSVLAHETKANLLDLAEVAAPTLITDSPEDVRLFAARHGPLVFKPLHRHRGTGVIRVESAADERLGPFVRRWGKAVVQPFLPAAYEGDKRINVVAFEGVSAVLTRPAPGDFICHAAAGGSEHPAEIDDDDRRILGPIISFLRERDLWWAAADVIGGYLTELNVTTPAMLRRADELSGGRPGLDAVLAGLERLAEERLAAPRV